MPSTLPTVEQIAEDHGLSRDRVHVSGPEYDAAVTLWNGAVTTRPALVVRCANTTDVSAAVRAARALGLRLSVRSGGNDWAGRALVKGGLVVDVSGMTDIEVDADANTARVGGGTRTDALAAAAEPHGLTPVTGTVGLVTVVGLSLGGGYGPLDGRFGLGSDNLLALEIVLADGSVRIVDAERDPELFWALRGGGGNFGVVTSAVARLHRLGPVHTGLVLYPWAQARSVLTDLAPLIDAAPDELSVQTLVMAGPDGAPMVGVMPTWSADLADGARMTDPFARLGAPLSAEIAPSTWHTMIAQAAAMFPKGRHSSIRARNIPSLTPNVVDAFLRAGDTLTSPLSALSVHHFHGAAARVPVADTAFGERRPHQMVEIIAMWEAGVGPAEEHVAWANSVHSDLAPESFPGGYVNLLGPDEADQIAHAYGNNAARLMAVKARVDPNGMFAATPLPTSGP